MHWNLTHKQMENIFLILTAHLSQEENAANRVEQKQITKHIQQFDKAMQKTKTHKIAAVST